MDCDQWVDPTGITDQQVADQLPLLRDNLVMTDVIAAQKVEFPGPYKRAGDDAEYSPYVLIQGAVYDVWQPTSTSPEYPRLVLPSTYWPDVITRAHQEVGHMATEKTVARLREAYTWPGMRKTVKEQLKLCPTCQVHRAGLKSYRWERCHWPHLPCK